MLLENKGEYDEENMRHKIEIREMERATRVIGKRKAVGRDQIPADTVKVTGTSSIMRQRNLFNKMYDSNIWSEVFINDILFSLRKKRNP